MSQCVARTKKGSQCTFPAAEGALVCRLHLKNATAEQVDPPPEDTADYIVDAVMAGADPEIAAIAAGVTAEELHIWLDTNAGNFRVRIQQALARLEVENIKAIAAASKRDWRAAVWIMDHARRPPTATGSENGSPPAPSPYWGGPSPASSGGGQGTATFRDDQVGPDGKPL
jgi:hypothetical protein